MFTGIVQGIGTIVAIEKSADGTIQTNWVRLPPQCADHLKLGASIANNGCCLSITGIKGEVVTFDLIEETLNRTNLSSFKVGDEINIERSMKVGDEIGGHVMSGHIIQTLPIVRIEQNEKNYCLVLSFPEEIKPYILEKGFIGLDGCSLTIGKVMDNEFCVYLIPETLNQTIFKDREVGDEINLEIDSRTQAIVDTVNRIMYEQFPDKVKSNHE